MALNIQTISARDWEQLRVTQPKKWIHSKWVTQSNNTLAKHKTLYDGNVYYDSSTRVTTDKNTLVFHDNTPIFYLFKVFSHSFLPSATFNDLPYWKKSSIDDSIVNRFKANSLNKYEGGNQLYFPNHSYTLFALQSLPPPYITRYEYIDIIVRAIKWSSDNRKFVVFKAHPFMGKDHLFFKIYLKMKERGLTLYTSVIGDVHDIDQLIDSSDRVWTFNSGVALTAILRKKPVATFSNSDYNPLCARCYTIEEAAAIKYPSEDLIYRYLSWYYHKFTIDISSCDVNVRLQRLFDHFYKDSKSLESYIAMDWK